jgi:hypothetical protein
VAVESLTKHVKPTINNIFKYMKIEKKIKIAKKLYHWIDQENTSG